MDGEKAESGSSRREEEEEATKFAVAISLLRSKLLQKPDLPCSHSEALQWKRKAKERKLEILRLTEEINQAHDASSCDLLPRSASCKCYFFDRLGKLSPRTVANSSDNRFDDVLRRRFLREVRFKERKRKASGSGQRQHLSDLGKEDETDQLRASVDFLIGLCESISQVEEANFENWSHQAVDFILGSLKNLLSMSKNTEIVEGIVCSLITRLVKKMLSPGQENGGSDRCKTNHQSYIQHLLRRLGSEPFIGQRSILSISEQIYVVGENLLFLDPFDVTFPQLHESMFTMIQLIEFLISDYLTVWLENEGFEKMLFEEWVTSIVRARKALELLESRNGLYVLYMDRVTGDLAKQLSQVSSLQKIKPDFLEKLIF